MNNSNDLNNIISKLTENPEMMKNLMGIAGDLMNNSRKDNENAVSAGSFDRHREDGFDRGKFDRDKKDDCCDDDDRSEHEKHGKRGDDAENLIRLLFALKPYVSPDRCAKIDSIVKILKLVQLSEKTGLLKSLL